MKAENDNHSVGGRVLISNSHPAFRGGVVYVRLEEISRADAESALIAELIIENIDHGDTETEIPFRLEIPVDGRIEPMGMYSVRVWVDTDGDGKRAPDDLYSDRAYRVLTYGFGDYVEIKL